MRRLLTLVVTCGLISPLSVKAAFDPKIHKICIDASDYEGCVEAHKESKQNQVIPETNNENRSKEKGFENHAQYQIDQGSAAVSLGYAKCLSRGKPLSREVETVLINQYKEEGIPLKYKNNKTVNKVANKLFQTNKENCQGIWERSVREVVDLIHSENKLKGLSNVDMANIIKPSCEFRVKDSNSPENQFLSYLELNACFICNEAYERNRKRKPSILSGEKTHKKEWYSRYLDISKAIKTGYGGDLKDPNILLNKTIEISSRYYCPSLY